MRRPCLLFALLPLAAIAAPWRDESAQRLPLELLSDRTMDAEFADADGDGDLDLFVAREFLPNLLLINDGNWRFSFQAGRLPGGNSDSEDIALADFDRDGDVDVVFANEDTLAQEHYVNDGSGRFTASAQALPAHGEANAVAAVDIDQDGDVDLVFAMRGADVLLVNDGTGRFVDAGPAVLPPGADSSQDVDAGDVDGNGTLDLLFGNEDGNRLLLQQAGRFVDASDRLPRRALREETREADLGDVDGDGDLDIVFGNVDFQNVDNAGDRLLINDGTGRFADETAARLPDIRQRTLDIDLVDLDRDGDPDLLAGNIQSGIGLQALLNDGRGTFREATREVFGDLLDRDTIGVKAIALPDRMYLYQSVFGRADRLLVRDDGGTAALDASWTGTFYEPTQAGHGFDVQVLPDGSVYIAWFTYDRSGRPFFLTGAGMPDGRVLDVALSLGDGMRFGDFDPATLTQRRWGTLRLTFVSCDRIDAEYRGEIAGSDGQPFGSGTLALQRLTRVADCR